MEEQKKSFFDALDSKSALLVGLVGGLLTLGTIGFVVLGSMVLKGQISLGGTTQQIAVAPSPTPNTQQNDPNAVAPSVVNVGKGHFPVRGNANAPVTIVEFADFRCPFCERFYTQTVKNILTDYVNTGKVQYYFRSYAFLGPASTVASEAAECANEQGKFWQFHDWLYDHQADESNTAYYDKDKVIGYAASIGLNRAAFASCLNSDKYASQVSADLSDGQQAGVQGTPTIFINGHALVGAQPYATVKAAIDQALAGK